METCVTREVALVGVLVLALAAGTAGAQPTVDPGPGGSAGDLPGDSRQKLRPPPEILNALGFVQQTGSSAVTTATTTTDGTTVTMRPFSIEIVEMLPPGGPQAGPPRPVEPPAPGSPPRAPLGGHVYVAGVDYGLVEIRLSNETVSGSTGDPSAQGPSRLKKISARLIRALAAPTAGQDSQEQTTTTTTSDASGATSASGTNGRSMEAGQLNLSIEPIDGRACALGTVQIKDSLSGTEASYTVYSTVLHALDRQPPPGAGGVPVGARVE